MNMNNSNNLIIPYYSPITAKGGKRRSRRTRKSRRSRRSHNKYSRTMRKYN